MTNEHPDTEDVEQIDTGQAPQLAENAAPEQASPEPADARNMFPSMYADEVPSMEEPADEDMKAVRREWTMYPAEINKGIEHTVFDEAIGKTIEIEGQQITVTREMTRKSVAELRGIAGDLGLNQQEAKSLIDNIKRIGQGLADGTGTRAGNREQAIQRLNATYGEEAGKALALSRAFVAKNPKLATILNRSGLGDDPTTVAQIARRAMALHEAGKLRLK